jgi:hypothetical protein
VGVATAPPPEGQARGLYVLTRSGSADWRVERRPGALFWPTTAFAPDGALWTYDPLRRALDRYGLTATR